MLNKWCNQASIQVIYKTENPVYLPDSPQITASPGGKHETENTL